jgi:site-specific DNA recombinase
MKRIFDIYTREQLGTAAVARLLTDEHAPSPAAGWQPAVVQWLLENEAYLGRVIWRGESLPGLHEPLIDEVTFARAQRLLRERGDDAALRRSNPGDYLLSGLLRCGRCKRAYVGMSAKGNGGTYHYYACSGRQKLGAKGCDGERIPRDKLEAAVVRQLASLYRDVDVIRDAIDAAAEQLRADGPALEEQRRALAEESRRGERALDRYYVAFEAGDLDAKRFQTRVAALETRVADLRGQDLALAARLAPQVPTTPDAANLGAVADQLEDVVRTGDLKQAKALLRLLIKDLRVNGRKEILPTYRVVTDTVCVLPSSVGAPRIEPRRAREGVACRPASAGVRQYFGPASCADADAVALASSSLRPSSEASDLRMLARWGSHRSRPTHLTSRKRRLRSSRLATSLTSWSKTSTGRIEGRRGVSGCAVPSFGDPG